jgi:hypothetical protein
MRDHSAPPCHCSAEAGRRPLLRGLLKALGLGLAGIAVMLGALALRSIPLAGQLWSRPDLARLNQQPETTAADRPPAEAAFRCC